MRLPEIPTGHGLLPAAGRLKSHDPKPEHDLSIKRLMKQKLAGFMKAGRFKKSSNIKFPKVKLKLPKVEK